MTNGFLIMLSGLWAMLMAAPFVYAILGGDASIGVLERMMRMTLAVIICHGAAVLLAMAIFQICLHADEQISGALRWVAFLPLPVSVAGLIVFFWA